MCVENARLINKDVSFVMSARCGKERRGERREVCVVVSYDR